MTYLHSNMPHHSGGNVAAGQAKAAAQDARERTKETGSQVERLYMIVEALWSLLKEEHGYTDDQLLKRVAEIDLKDGALDGRTAPSQAPKCPHCGHTTSKSQMTCVFCGKPMRIDLFAR